jgi:hypothetical protein
MNKAIRTTLSLVVSLVLLSMVTMAQAGSNADMDKSDKSKQHHGHLAKAAFWRHHKDSSKSTKPAQPAHSNAQPAQAKAAQLKPTSAKLPAGKTQKQEPQAKTVSKPASKSASATKANAVTKTNSSVKPTAANTKTKSSASKSPATSKVKPQPKTQEPQTVSLKQ